VSPARDLLYLLAEAAGLAAAAAPAATPARKP
jgi:hypothetical protein